MNKINLIIAFLFSAILVSGQEGIIGAQSVMQRRATIQQTPPDSDKQYAEAFARENGIPIRVVYEDGTIHEIRRISKLGQPEYYTTHNLNAAKTTSTNKLWQDGELGLDLDGSGIVVGVWDGGHVRTSHKEFESRARTIDNAEEVIFHATHVAGTIAAAGIRSDARGMAGKSIIDSYDWDGDNSEMRSAAQMGMLISNHSYGYIQGWEYNNEKNRWEWYGDESISKTEDYNFGFYGQDARFWDEIAYDYPKFLIVKSAGNDRGEGPASGTTHFVWSRGSWVSSTEVRDRDGNGSYDCIGTQGTSKNILTVGAVDDIPAGYSKPSDVSVASFSVFGPTDDGRIKPDIVGNGVGLLSASSSRDDSYAASTGTSMASPNVAGSLALLQEHYHDLYGTYMYASMLKSLVLHTADDAGNPGPDYQYGWGLINAASAADLISGSDTSIFFSDTLQETSVNEYSYYSTGETSLKITMAWTDPAGEVPGIALDPVGRILVNDLDIRLVRQIDGQVFRPFRLDPANPGQPATRGDNNLDNVEQILVETPLQGYYTLEVSHKFFLENETQSYGVTVSGLTNEYVASGEILKTGSNGEVLLTSASRYLDNMDVKWMIQPENGLPVSFYFDHFNTEQGKDLLTIYDGDKESDPLLAQFSGALTDTDTLIQSTGGNMLVIFRSDDANTEAGFMARYCTVAPGGEVELLGNLFPCENTVSPYFALGEEGAEFEWSSQQQWMTQSTTFNGIELSVETADDLLQVQSHNRCGEGLVAEQLIRPLDAPPELTMITGDSIICDGVATSFATDILDGATYTWGKPALWTGISDLPTISLKARDVSGVVTVEGQNACGTGNQLALDVQVLDVPEPEQIRTDKVPPCQDSEQQFYIDPLPGHTYRWAVNNDWDIVGDDEQDTVLIRVGDNADFVEVMTENQCGSRESNRLFLTEKLPDAPKLTAATNDFGYTVLTVENSNNFAGIQWYRNGEPIPGAAGLVSPLIISRNGLYTAASVSENQCINRISDDKGYTMSRGDFTFVSFRNSPTTIVIENTLEVAAEVNIISSLGRVMYVREVQPGHNEIPFSEQGIYLLHFFGYGSKQVVRVVY
ncbi:MAG: S8 family serine peptidase [Bacteroidales bacterium]|nr:S8 family serine peptidase [Bacteroidales bacterium]MDT8432800.1 S8 family serine peptidase [Bacteroidales bacterium]